MYIKSECIMIGKSCCGPILHSNNAGMNAILTIVANAIAKGRLRG